MTHWRGFRGRFLAMINELDILFYEHNPNGMFNIKNMPAAISTCHEATNTTKINNWDPNMHIFLRPTPEMPTHARLLYNFSCVYLRCLGLCLVPKYGSF
ncbi:unnamed protein product, partial [Mesorhabditis belari]|uniref:Uncharacterized protein n=1 Tax=Mesorhabditis belari TaxID=2138241 RepID=A0AAF3JBC7_9BILA